MTTPAKWLTGARRTLLAGVPGGHHAQKAPQRLVGACLRALGLRARRTKVGSTTDGTRTDGYILDMDHALAWAKANSRAWRRDLGLHVPALEVEAMILDHRQGRDIWAGDDDEIDILLGQVGGDRGTSDPHRPNPVDPHRQRHPGAPHRPTPEDPEMMALALDDLFDAVVVAEPTTDDECEAPPEAWAFVRDESRSLDERVRVVLASPSPPHVQRVLLAALGVDTDGLRMDAMPVVGGDPQRSPPCPSTPTPSPSPPPST